MTDVSLIPGMDDEANRRYPAGRHDYSLTR